MAIERSYGWHPSVPDHRDWQLATEEVDETTIPDVDLRTPDPAAGRTFLPAVYNQLKLGSCTANMVGAAYSFDLAKLGTYDYLPSRLFVYYCERTLENTVASDSGATIAIAAQTLGKFGAPPEDDWPYDINQFTLQPPKQAFADGLAHRAIQYARVDQTASAIAQVLQAGTPVCFGFAVFSTFEDPTVAASGVVVLPGPTDRSLGGHAVLIVGRVSGQTLLANLRPRNVDVSRIDPTIAYYVVRNSWGADWGDSGYFYMPETYTLNPQLASDFWVIQSVATPPAAPIVKGRSPSYHRTRSQSDRRLIRELDPWARQFHIGRAANRAALAYINWKSTR